MEPVCRWDLSAGSSPLARGTRVPKSPTVLKTRFIPTRAGNTHPNSNTVSHRTVHPHSRGEHFPHLLIHYSCGGSSPLARGTPNPVFRRPLSRRFIPTRAGNTAARGPVSRGWPVHPHSRGEHSTSFEDGASITGSSPLARGTPTPARPGPPRRSVHPHSRGEHSMRRLCSATSGGSSPLARGTRSRKSPRPP